MHDFTGSDDLVDDVLSSPTFEVPVWWALCGMIAEQVEEPPPRGEIMGVLDYVLAAAGLAGFDREESIRSALLDSSLPTREVEQLADDLKHFVTFRTIYSACWWKYSSDSRAINESYRDEGRCQRLADRVYRDPRRKKLQAQIAELEAIRRAAREELKDPGSLDGKAWRAENPTPPGGPDVDGFIWATLRDAPGVTPLEDLYSARERVALGQRFDRAEIAGCKTRGCVCQRPRRRRSVRR